MDIFCITFKTIFFYFFISIIYRIMGKREIGQLGIIDLIVSILIAELVAISIESKESIALTLIPIIVLAIIEISLAYISIKSKTFRILMQGKPSLIICEGKINYHELIKQRYNLDDLLLNLRQNKIKSIEEVEYAFLESNGKLSIFTYNSIKHKVFPLPIILDGKIEEKYLNKTPFNKRKIVNMIENNNLKLENIFYGFYQDKKIFITLKDKKKTYLDNKNIM